MTPTHIPVVQPVPLPAGTATYEAARLAVLQRFAAAVPKELLLPDRVIQNPPKTVVGVPRQCGLLSEAELDITENYDATALAEAIASKKLTSTAVVTAFAKRAMIAHQLTCCLTEWFMDEAIARAQELDDHLAATGQTVGPLHGVPITIKSHIPIAGHWRDLGYLDTLTKDTKDSQMVAILRSAGAVFYCKTNQPQSLMHLESTSFYGRTLNPHNIKLSAGGSTGGEAALIALRGSVLGVGTDIGGSVRGPCAFCGIYGFKPTSYSLPMKDFLAGGVSAELNVLCSTGPMALTLRDMDLFMAVVIGSKPWIEDPRVIPIPWTGMRTSVGQQVAEKCRIGLMMHDGVIIPQPPVTRALNWAKSRLEKAGFQVKLFKPYKVARIMENIRKAYWPAGTKYTDAHHALTGEPKHPLTEWIQREAAPEELLVTAVLEQRLLRDDMRSEFSLDWENQGVDVILCPAFVGPASSHDTAWYWDYTAMWNYLDCPGVVIPTPIKALKKGEEEYDVKDALGVECARVRKLWDEGDFEDAPVNLQLVGRRYHDNELFQALAAAKDALQLR
ncbi:acetamidase [Metarhizium album ARSEF 1941]|uniref:Acetamidase n=1 Tax=Metarhizium album (strain ARSEF 1941) TaxID=1081103 RepID=A0A0B2WZJ5_METAS|nr:acetamidase [Metarhizium album ARSEF 1941]KHN99009.1 acetamidase [Metarhizium album ARSEF 1941]